MAGGVYLSRPTNESDFRSKAQATIFHIPPKKKQPPVDVYTSHPLGAVSDRHSVIGFGFFSPKGDEVGKSTTINIFCTQVRRRISVTSNLERPMRLLRINSRFKVPYVVHYHVALLFCRQHPDVIRERLDGKQAGADTGHARRDMLCGHRVVGNCADGRGRGSVLPYCTRWKGRRTKRLASAAKAVHTEGEKASATATCYFAVCFCPTKGTAHGSPKP